MEAYIHFRWNISTGWCAPFDIPLFHIFSPTGTCIHSPLSTAELLLDYFLFLIEESVSMLTMLENTLDVCEVFPRLESLSAAPAEGFTRPKKVGRLSTQNVGTGHCSSEFECAYVEYQIVVFSMAVKCISSLRPLPSVQLPLPPTCPTHLSTHQLFYQHHQARSPNPFSRQKKVDN